MAKTVAAPDFSDDIITHDQAVYLVCYRVKTEAGTSFALGFTKDYEKIHFPEEDKGVAEPYYYQMAGLYRHADLAAKPGDVAKAITRDCHQYLMSVGVSDEEAKRYANAVAAEAPHLCDTFGPAPEPQAQNASIQYVKDMLASFPVGHQKATKATRLKFAVAAPGETCIASLQPAKDANDFQTTRGAVDGRVALIIDSLPRDVMLEECMNACDHLLIKANEDPAYREAADAWLRHELHPGFPATEAVEFLMHKQYGTTDRARYHGNMVYPNLLTDVAVPLHEFGFIQTNIDNLLASYDEYYVKPKQELLAQGIPEEEVVKTLKERATDTARGLLAKLDNQETLPPTEYVFSLFFDRILNSDTANPPIPEAFIEKLAEHRDNPEGLMRYVFGDKLMECQQGFDAKLRHYDKKFDRANMPPELG